MAKGKLKKDGRFDKDTFKYVQQDSSDEKMIEVVKESIEAVDAAGYLKYLKKFDGKDLDLTLKQDEKEMTGIVQSEFETKERAMLWTHRRDSHLVVVNDAQQMQSKCPKHGEDTERKRKAKDSREGLLEMKKVKQEL